MSYVDLLGRELGAVRIRGRLRRRILAEFADHLACDPAAALGEPSEVAHAFADQLGSSRARRAAIRSFAALTVAAAVFIAAFVASVYAGPGLPRLHPAVPALAYLAALGAVVGPQLAFVAGLAGLALEYRHGLAGWWTTAVLAGAGVSGLGLLAAAPAVASACSLRPTLAGPVPDLFDDLGGLVPPALRGRPWRFALAVAGALAVAIALAGVVQSDPFDGLARGLADGAACLAGFAVLGRYLGLRR